MNPWETLGLGQDAAVADLRRRYAALIKEFRPETHPQDFARIRAAYEVALPYARRREAEAAEEVERAALPADATSKPAVDEPPAPAMAGAPMPASSQHLTAEATAVVVAPTGEADAPADDADPDLATRFRRFHALTESVQGTRDEALLPELRVLLQARARGSLDDSQALEFALLRRFIESESPPLTLLFETGRAFDWHTHVVRLSGWLSPWALRQMEARLALSRDLVYARHFSGNRWLRRLHSIQPRLPLIVFRPSALEALHWVERWQQACEAADTKALDACLDARTVKRLRGLATTDALAGIAAAAMGPDLPVAVSLGFAVVATVIVFASRLALQAIARQPESHWLRAFARKVAGNKLVAALLSAAAGGFGIALIFSPASTSPEVAVGCVLAVPGVLVAMALVWRLASWLELLVANVFAWRDAVDRLEFDRLVKTRGMPVATGAFGSRLALPQRLKAIRAALRLQTTEIALRERPPRAKPFKLVRIVSANGKPSLGRLAWIIAWIIFAIARLAHLGSSSS
jgi:hypothetical protein